MSAARRSVRFCSRTGRDKDVVTARRKFVFEILEQAASDCNVATVGLHTRNEFAPPCNDVFALDDTAICFLILMDTLLPN